MEDLAQATQAQDAALAAYYEQSASAAVFNDPYRWYSLAPNAVIFFFAIFLGTKAMEWALHRFCSVYREHLTWRQKRKFISHAWLAIGAILGFILQCIAYQPALFTGEAVGIDKARMLLSVSTFTVIIYMHDLAYTVADPAVVCHHLATATALVLVSFSVYNNLQLQLFLMFSTILLMFETLSGTTYIAVLLHRLWSSPVPHPTRQIWAKRFMFAAACWFVFTRVLVYAFGITRFVQVFLQGEGAVGSLFQSPVSPLAGPWFWVWAIAFPLLLAALLYAHYHTAYVLFKLALRDTTTPAAKGQGAADDMVVVVVAADGKEDNLIAT